MSKVWIALFRGINVGGHHKLPMKALTQALLEDGLTDVKTYIASGNVVFRSTLAASTLKTRIEDVVEKGFGFRPRTFVITLAHLDKVLAANPYKDAEHQGKAQHIFFFEAAPTSVDRAVLDTLKAPSEAYTVTDEVLYLYAPEGIGRSKLVEKIERAVAADMTARNLNTVLAVRELAAASTG